MTPEVEAAVTAAFREEWGQVVATLIGLTGDWDLAEECAQDAFTAALQRWPVDGVPLRPGAWLTTTARNRATDRLRRDAVGARKLREVATLAEIGMRCEPAGPDDAAVSGIHDDRLRLMFTCCHPALAFESQVALALRTLAGLSTAEIGRAFLVPEQTMSKRLVRARQKIRQAGIPYRIPPAHLLPERTAAVLGVLYLLFNEGYAATTGDDLVRQGLSAEAIRLARVLAQLMPDEPEARGLLALMLLQDARRATRVDEAGELVVLERQDRSRWDAGEITEGVALLEGALRRGRPGPYQVQAAIAACHATAPDAAATDWAEIAALYGRLAQFVPSPVVRLNRAVAVGMADGPAAGFALVEELAASGALTGYHLLPATRADLLRRLDRRAEAADAYREALALVTNGAERRYLARRSAELAEDPPPGVVLPDRFRPSVGQTRSTSTRRGTMNTVVTADGTTIAFDRSGSGPAVILVVGAFNDRSTGAPLAAHLAADFTVYSYDRRGRGDSGDTPPYAVEREIEDLAALIAEAGGSAAVFGYSSGAVLALKAAAHRLPVTRLALFEPAPRRAGAGRTGLAELAVEVAALIRAGRRGDAVELFQIEAVGLPEELVVGLRQAPFRPALEKMAHTLVYELTILDDPALAGELPTVPVPTLVIDGALSPDPLRDAARELAGLVPHGRHLTLAGQDHTYDPAVLAPVLAEFYAA